MCKAILVLTEFELTRVWTQIAIISVVKELDNQDLTKHEWCRTLEIVSANKWPEAARQRDSKHKNTLDSIPWISAFVPQISAFVPGISAFVFGAIVLKKTECLNSPIDAAAKPCRRLLKAFNHSINSMWVPATMPQSMHLCCDASWSSDPCGNFGANDSFSTSLFCCLASWRPRRPNKQATPFVLKISRFWKKKSMCFRKCVKERTCLKKHCFPMLMFSKWIHFCCILMAA